MSFGRNDLITRAYAESMISRSNRGLSEQVKSIQEQVVALNIDFAGLRHSIESLKKGDPSVEQRVKELIDLFTERKFIAGVIQTESQTKMNVCSDSISDDKSLSFSASGDKLPIAINRLILSILQYALMGKQD